MPEPGVNAASPEVLAAIDRAFRDAVFDANNAYLLAVGRAGRTRNSALHKAIVVKRDAVLRADAKARANAADG